MMFGFKKLLWIRVVCGCRFCAIIHVFYFLKCTYFFSAKPKQKQTKQKRMKHNHDTTENLHAKCCNCRDIRGSSSVCLLCECVGETETEKKGKKHEAIFHLIYSVYLLVHMHSLVLWEVTHEQQTYKQQINVVLCYLHCDAALWFTINPDSGSVWCHITDRVPTFPVEVLPCRMRSILQLNIATKW